jgi:hypothetical protein
VAVDTNVEATFSEAMNPNTISTTTFTLTKQGDPTPLAATVSYDAASKNATLDPTSDLEAGATYTATLKGGATGVKDLAGNALTADKTWSFTTVAPADTTAPTVSTVAPQDGATDVALSTNVEATFSEDMDASTIDGTTFTLTKQGATTPVGATVAYDAANKKVVLDPNADLDQGATYTATVKGGTGGVKDLAGNALAADKTRSFTTAVAAPSNLLFSEDFTAPDGSTPTNWTVNRSAGGTGAGAAIRDNTLREDVILSSAQDGILQYVQARAKPVQPNWSTTQLDFLWQMQTDANANTGQSIDLFLAPQAATGNVSNASDYLRVRVANGQVSLLRRVGGGSPTTIWSGPITSGTTLRQFQLRIDGTNLSLYEGAVGSSPTLRVGPIAHGLTWTSGYLYLHAHNSSSATPYRARFDTVRIYDRG